MPVPQRTPYCSTTVGGYAAAKAVVGSLRQAESADRTGDSASTQPWRATGETHYAKDCRAGSAIAAASSILWLALRQAHRAASAEQPYVIGVSNEYTGTPPRRAGGRDEGLRGQTAVKPKIKELVINNAGTSVAKQIAAVDQMIAQKVDAIILTRTR